MGRGIIAALVLWALAGAAEAQQADHASCGAYRAKWNAAADLTAMDAAIAIIPGICPKLLAEARAGRMDAAFSKAQQTNSAGAYQDFLRRYPTGAYSDAARSALVRLGSAPPAIAMAKPTPARPAPARSPQVAVVTPVVAPPPASPPAQKEFRDCADCPQMVRLPGDTFQMGDTSGGGDADEKPVHSVTLSAFAIGKYEVTRGEYAAFTRDSGRAIGGDCNTVNSAGSGFEKQASATWQSPGFSQSERDPVVCVSWEDAKAYVAWLSQKTGQRYRLLSESEWEYAARAGSSSKFWWGAGDNDACGYANGADQTAKQKFSNWTTSSCNDGQLYTASVGSYRPNGFGLYDTAGNVWEWVEDCYADTYDLQPRNGAAYTSGACSSRVLRGGSWNYDPQYLRSAFRFRITPTSRDSYGGFRVARTL